MRIRFLKESHKRRLTESTDSYFQAYITNLGKYNEGELVGEWVSFPIDVEEFNSILNNIGIDDEYEEWFVTDYDCNVDAYHSLGEYPSFEQLNEFGEMIEDDAFKALLEDQPDFESAKDLYESEKYEFYPGAKTWSDVAYRFIDECGGIKYLDRDTIEKYFDYEKLGQDLSGTPYDDPITGEEVTAEKFWCGDEDASDEDLGYAYVDANGIESVVNPENYFNYEEYGDEEFSYDGAITDYGIIVYI